MSIPNIFSPEICQSIIDRINSLTPQTPAKWGKMGVDQMLAHCNVTYEMLYENIHPKPNFLMKIVLKKFVKPLVTNEVPYKHNSQTAPAFLVKESKDFDKEKARLIAYLQRTQQEGAASFHHKESHSFGPLTTQEWNNLLYKHMDHHLRQFGV
jgi:hypothetical protein